ncbi:hypothetical protein [Blastococcus sp. CCUG 61487]|uniref:hypothetical protein n=1 Tax=Blastococcus sp. CCUG 61487 TaxID=1840703 RepID=UPI00201E5B5B|nr:hypothetical protein [Blastococcus sp. CCUG 61487]
MQRLGELDLLGGAEQQGPPPVRQAGQLRGDEVRAAGVQDGELLEVQRGQGQRQPAVCLQESAGRLLGRRLVGEQAGVDRHEHRGVHVVGARFDVRQVRQRQRRPHRRQALGQGLAGGADRRADGLEVAVDLAAPRRHRGPPRAPVRLVGPGQGVVDLVEDRPEGADLPVAGVQQVPQGRLQRCPRGRRGVGRGRRRRRGG